MDGWVDAERGDVESRTWLAMDLLAAVHELWAIEGGDGAACAVAELTEGLLGEHRPALTEAALAGLLDLERALVVGAALDAAAGLVAPDVLAPVEDVLVGEACGLALIPLVNAAADLLLELERDAAQRGADAAGADQGVRAGRGALRAEPGGDRPSGEPAAPTGPAATTRPRPGAPRAAAPRTGAARTASCRHTGRLVGGAAAAQGRASARTSIPAAHGRAARPGPALVASTENGRSRVRNARRPRGPPRRRPLPHGERRAHEDRPGERSGTCPGGDARRPGRPLSPARGAGTRSRGGRRRGG